MGNEIKFKPATFYLGIVDHLAKAVEGLKPEDMTAERTGGDQGAKRDHSELLDGASQGVEAEQATAAPEERSTEPSGKGDEEGSGLPTLGPSEPTVTSKHHNEVAGVPMIPDPVAPTLTRKPISDTLVSRK